MFEFQPSQIALTMTPDDLLNRPLSVLAVLTVIGAAAGLGAFIHPVACAASLCSLCFGILALSQVRRYEYSRSSRFLMTGGLSISVMSLIAAPAWHLLLYQSEASPGYQRVTFDELFTRTAESDDSYAPRDVRPTRLLFDDSAGGFDGEQICVKGYVYPTRQFDGLTEFLLTANGSGQHERYVGVVLTSGTSWDWTKDGVAVSGLLELNPAYTTGSTLGVRYILKDASVRPARTLYGMEFRSRDGGC
jgi:hypothetical protein